MFRIATPLLAAAVLCLSASAARADDKEKLQGQWSLVSMSINGMALPAEAAKDGVLTFKGDKAAFGGKDDKPDEDMFELGKSGEHATIVITDKQGKKHRGIYKFEDDGKTLTMAFTDGPEFPAKFEAPKPEKEGVENILMVVKKKA